MSYNYPNVSLGFLVVLLIFWLQNYAGFFVYFSIGSLLLLMHILQNQNILKNTYITLFQKHLYP